VNSVELFTDKAELYKKFRSPYPGEFIEYLYSQVGFKADSVIADIGSGTGIFSRQLLEKGTRVYCVEPNDDMRRTAEKDLSEFDNFISVNAPAEDTGLQDRGFDFVTAATAFHWFDREEFRSESQRIIKDSGKVVLVWNIRDYEREIIKKDFVIREKYGVDLRGLAVSLRIAKDLPDFFTGGSCEINTFRNDMPVDRETYLGMNLSRSYSPKENENPEKYHAFVKELNALFDEYQVDGLIVFPQITKSYVGLV
jgi:SAM-dependent methyltransferase